MKENQPPIETFVWLSVESDVQNAKGLSELVGLACDRSWTAGEQRGRTKLVFERNGWALDSRLDKTRYEVEAHLEDLLRRVRPFADKIRTLAEANETVLHCVQYTNRRTSFSLPPHIVSWIGELGASLDVEIYFLPDDAERPVPTEI
jgi:hypothetical protein